MIKFLYNNLKSNANNIKGWEDMSKSEIANLYCDYDEKGDIENRDYCLSALMCKYWFMVTYLYNTSRSARLDVEDFTSWLYESLEKAFQYRKWRDKSNPLSKDVDAPEKIINRCIYSTRNRWYTYFNKDKRKINFLTYYLQDAPKKFKHDYNSDENNCEFVDNMLRYDEDYINSCDELIESFIKKGDILSALILDGICNQDSFKEDSKSKEFSFSIAKLKKHLLEFNINLISYFKDKYSVDEDKLNESLNKLQSMTGTTLNRCIKKTLTNFKENSMIRETLCY